MSTKTMSNYEDALLAQILMNLMNYAKQYNHKLIDKIKKPIGFYSKWENPDQTLLKAMALSYKSKIAQSVTYNLYYYSRIEEQIYTYDLHKELSLIGTRMISLLERMSKKFKTLSKRKDPNILGEIYHMFRCYISYGYLKEKLRQRINSARKEAGLKEHTYLNNIIKIGE